jgi:hypothetical protein
LKKHPLEALKACLPACISAVKVLLPKDQVLLQEAAKYSEGLLKNVVPAPAEALVAPVPATEVAPVVAPVPVVVVVSETDVKVEEAVTPVTPVTPIESSLPGTSETPSQPNQG